MWLVVYSQLNDEAFSTRERKAIDDLGKSIQTQIFTASDAHSGYKSQNLFIPLKIGNIDYDVITSHYAFILRAHNQDFTFHTPYVQFVGNGLEKNKVNILWNVCGVVCIGEIPCLSDSDCNVYFTQCSDGIDDDLDGIMDQKDGGCWSNASGYPTYTSFGNNESPAGVYPPQPPGWVFNFYPQCKRANETPGLCDNMITFPAIFNGTIPLFKQNCTDFTPFCQ